MTVKISYFILFGIITIAIGKPANIDNGETLFVKNEYDLQKLLQLLNNHEDNYEVAAPYRENGLSNHRGNKASSSRFDDKPRQSYGRNDKADAPLYFDTRDNAVEDQSSINSLQIINQLLDRNDDNQEASNVQGLLENVLSSDRNKFKIFKPKDKTDKVEDILALLDGLPTNIAADGDYASVLSIKESKNRNNDLYENAHIELPRSIAELGNPTGGSRYEEKESQSLLNRIRSLLVQAKKGVIKLIQKIVGFKLRTDYNDRYDLRCNGKTCARIDKNNRLRCTGKSCAKYDDDDTNIVYDPKLRTNKIKVNDELDAVILGLTDVENLLTTLNAKQQRTNTQTGAKLNKNVELENLLNSRSSGDKKSNVEAIVFDLTQIENGDTVAKQIKQLLSQNNEAGSYDEYDDYANGLADNMKEASQDLAKLIETDKTSNSKLPRKEENVYLPQWLLDEVISRSNSKKLPVNEKPMKSKSVFPLTRQQKERIAKKKSSRNQNTQRIFRRNLVQDVGAPFHLEVKGLGQVNP